VAGQPPLAPGNLIVADVDGFEVTSGGPSEDDCSGSGIEINVTSQITALEPPDHFRLASGHRFQVCDSTEFLTPLSGYGDLSVGMRVEAEGHMQQDGDIGAKKIKLED
jgi:hypothetical protein